MLLVVADAAVRLVVRRGGLLERNHEACSGFAARQQQQRRDLGRRAHFYGRRTNYSGSSSLRLGVGAEGRRGPAGGPHGRRRHAAAAVVAQGQRRSAAIGIDDGLEEVRVVHVLRRALEAGLAQHVEAAGQAAGAGARGRAGAAAAVSERAAGVGHDKVARAIGCAGVAGAAGVAQIGGGVARVLRGLRREAGRGHGVRA